MAVVFRCCLHLLVLAELAAVYPEVPTVWHLCGDVHRCPLHLFTIFCCLPPLHHCLCTCFLHSSSKSGYSFHSPSFRVFGDSVHVSKQILFFFFCYVTEETFLDFVLLSVTEFVTANSLSSLTTFLG